MQRTGWNKRLLGSTRGKIIGLLRTETRTVNDLAAALKLTDNAVRAHLLRLERDGLVEQRGTRPGTRKPHAAYALTGEAEHIFPKAYAALLNHLLSAVSHRLTPRVLRSTMNEVGRAMARDHLDKVKGRPRRDRIQLALSVFNDLGGSAALSRQGGREFIHGRNGCPLSAVSAVHPEACWIMEALLSQIVGVPAKKCCQYGETPRCCFELTAK
jgi:predicted ArsR family transcriptional regulator